MKTISIQTLLTKLASSSLAMSDKEVSNLELQLLSIQAGNLVCDEIQTELTQTQYIFGKDIASDVYIIPVYGTLVGKFDWQSNWYTGYSWIKRELKRAIENKVSKIILDISSGGGQTMGLRGLTDFINKIPTVHGIETIAFTDSYMCSAAYAIASSCQKVYMNQSAETASIGTLCTIYSCKKANEEAGYDIRVLRSYSDKAIYNPNEELSANVIEQMTTELNTVNDKFVNSILSYRNTLSLDTIKELNGRCVFAEEALEKGLVDGIVSSIEELVGLQPDRTNEESTTLGINLDTLTNKGGKTMDYAQKVIELQAEIEDLKSSQALLVGTEVQKERKRCSAIIKAGSVFGIDAQKVEEFVSKGKDTDYVNDIFEAYASKKDAETTISPVANMGSTTQSMKDDMQQSNNSSFLDSFTQALDKLGA